MKLEELEKRITKLEKELKKANKGIKDLNNYMDKIESDNDLFNGYF